MKVLNRKTRSQILHMLCEGNSICSVTRLTGANKNTVMKLLVDAGHACAAFHDANVGDVKAKRVQVDEIWSFIYAKQKYVASAVAAPHGAGDTCTWTAIDADSKMILSNFVGGCDGECAMWSVDDLRSRLAGRILLTNDGHNRQQWPLVFQQSFGKLVTLLPWWKSKKPRLTAHVEPIIRMNANKKARN